MGEISLRDGDVLTPAVEDGSATITGLLLASRAFRLPAMLRMVLLACCLFSPATAMFAVPEAHVAPPICVGKFPWRVAPELRLLHESVDHGRACTLLSPFSVMEDKRVAVSPEDSVDDVRVALSGSEPAWSRDIMPVWPTPAPDHMVLVPVAPADSLACVLIVTPEWQLPMLVPCRADVAWVLAYLRSVSPGAVVSIRGPLSLSHQSASQQEPARWRDGDLVLAFPTHIEASAIDTPAFSGAVCHDVNLHVRHTALWAMDFTVDAALKVVLWMGLSARLLRRRSDGVLRVGNFRGGFLAGSLALGSRFLGFTMMCRICACVRRLTNSDVLS